jgi:sugar lactone lactonase YvrE
MAEGVYNLAYSTSSGKAYFDDSDWGMIYEFDPEAGTVEVLNTLGETSGMVVDEAAGALIAIQGGGLVSIDVTTGAVTVISDGSTGSGPTFSSPHGLSVNAARTVAWILDHNLDALFRVDLSTGAREIVADATIGTGESLEDFSKLVVDDSAGKAYLTRAQLYASSDAPNGLIIVDLATGDRVLMDQDSNASRSPLAWPDSIIRDSATGLLYLSDPRMKAIVVVDPITGCNGVRSAAQ